MLSRLMCYQSLSLSEAGPKENKPCSMQSHVGVIFPLENLLLNENGPGANERIKEH